MCVSDILKILVYDQFKLKVVIQIKHNYNTLAGSLD